jgi:uncharacterized protein (TIGR02597 family)
MNLKVIFMLAGIVPGSLLAQESTTDPVGFNKVTCLRASSTALSVPFMESENSFTGVVGNSVSVTGTSPDNTVTFNVKNTPNFTVNGFQGMYYLRFGSGELAGSYYQIKSNTSNTITLNLEGDDGSLISENDVINVYRLSTLSTLFPDGNSTVVPSTGTASSARMTEIRIIPRVSSGVFGAVPSVYYWFNGEWRNAANNSNADNVILWPDSSFVLRHTSNVPANTTFVAKGLANVDLNIIPIFTEENGVQVDNVVSWPRPIPVQVQNMNLIGSGVFTSSPSTSPADRKDILFVVRNEIPGNLDAKQMMLIHVGTNWIRVDDGSNSVVNTMEITPSQGLLVRKRSGNGTTLFWQIPAAN